MAWSFLFSNVSTLYTTQIDADLAQIADNLPVPCAVTGANALSITPLFFSPGINGYLPLQRYAFTAASNNTTAVTAGIGGLASLGVYLDTPTGPQALSGGEIVAGNLCVLTYDQSLNTGAGGFHLSTGPTGAYLPLIGGALTGPLLGTSATLSGALFAGTVNAFVTVTSSSLVATTRISGPSITASGGLAGGSIIAGGGTPITRVVSAAASIGFTALPAGSYQDATIAVTGALPGDSVALGMPTNVTAGIAYAGFVSATSVATVRAQNVTAGTLTPTGGSYRATAIGFT